MNFREGMHRLGLTLGIIGAVGGGLVAFVLISTFWSQWKEERDENLRFQSLMNSRTVQILIEVKRHGGFIPDNQGGMTPDTRAQSERDQVVKVRFDDAGNVTWLELENGNVVQNRQVPSAPWGVTVACIAIPLLGFVVPWGLVQVITWIGLGFLRKSD